MAWLGKSSIKSQQDFDIWVQSAEINYRNKIIRPDITNKIAYKLTLIRAKEKLEVIIRTEITESKEYINFYEGQNGEYGWSKTGLSFYVRKKTIEVPVYYIRDANMLKHSFLQQLEELNFVKINDRLIGTGSILEIKEEIINE